MGLNLSYEATLKTGSAQDFKKVCIQGMIKSSRLLGRRFKVIRIGIFKKTAIGDVNE